MKNLTEMEATFSIWKTSRAIYLNFLNSYTLEQLNYVPEGMSNNIIWNIGHIIAAQQGLVYRLSGLTPLVSETFIDKYKNGSVPNGETTQEEVDEIKELLVSTLNQTITDFEKGKFTSYNEYQTKTGFLLRNSEDAIQFNNYHEGIHLGFIMKIKKYIK